MLAIDLGGERWDDELRVVVHPDGRLAAKLRELGGTPTERTELSMVGRPPFPFPPEPLRWAGVALTRRAIQRSDEREGRRGPWLGLLDRFGIGFDS